MEIVSVKFEKEFVKEIESIMKKNRYITKAEFIREAVRERIKELKKEMLLRHLRKIYGSSKRKTTDEELHKAGEEAFRELKKEINNSK